MKSLAGIESMNRTGKSPTVINPYVFSLVLKILSIPINIKISIRRIRNTGINRAIGEKNQEKRDIQTIGAKTKKAAIPNRIEYSLVACRISFTCFLIHIL